MVPIAASGLQQLGRLQSTFLHRITRNIQPFKTRRPSKGDSKIRMQVGRPQSGEARFGDKARGCGS
jgi:hypothetical protein